ncbi:MAG: (d)CMP kinase [Gammaproteobacteria bacterium]|nr:(d)CMP kinase [Gammaproteobacteria bacterium]
MTIPVVTIDGPGGSGKGTVSQLLAARLAWHYLDSGALYRAVGLAAQEQGVHLDDPAALARLARGVDIRFEPQADGRPAGVWVDGRDVGDVLRTEDTGHLASQVAQFAGVRAALLDKQRDFRRPPGLVADGRDMGTTVFPEALLKVFLTASPEVRAERRYKQLKEKGLDVTLLKLLGEIRERDARDAARQASPLRPAADAEILDTSGLSIAEAVETIFQHLRQRL